jgi:folliculin
MIIAFSNFCEVHGPSIISCSQGFQINQFYKLEKIIHENSNKNSTKNTCSGCSLIVPQQSSNPTEKSEEQENSGFQQSQLTMDMNFEQNQLNNQLTNANDIQKQLDNNSIMTADEEEEDNPLQINIKNDNTKGIINNSKRNQLNETQTINSGNSINKLNSNKSVNENDVGFKGFISDDIDNNMTYITTRYPYLSRLYPIVRQACVRSLSCEFCPGREGAIFFGDEQNGYSLSYIFKLKDIQARGFQRWYSISFLHSDKSFIIASWGFLVSKFKATAKDLQANAEKIFEFEKRTNQEVNNRVKVYSPLSPEQFIRRRGNQPLRSLVDLLNNPNVFMQLHSTFSWILRASSDRLYEKRQENYDMMDSILNLKYNELTYSSESENNCNEDVILLDQEGMPVNINGTNPQKEVLENPVSKPVMIENLKDLWRIFGEMHFKYLIYNTAIGTQIIIRTDKIEIATSIIKVLKSFIPESCCTSYEYLDEYIEPWRCNMLGIKKDVKIPTEIDESNYVLIDITTDENTNEIIDIQFKPVIDQLQTNYPFQKSVLIDQLEQIVKSDIPSKVFDIQMFVFREKWLNKAKLFFKFIKLGKTETENKQDSVINVLNVNRSDIPIMLYFSRGLGKNDRQILLRD